MTSSVKRVITAAALVLMNVAPCLAQKLRVDIINRQDNEDEYDYAAVYDNVAVGKSFKIHGAAFTLQLPDGRLAIVNCESKFAEHTCDLPGQIVPIVTGISDS